MFVLTPLTPLLLCTYLYNLVYDTTVRRILISILIYCIILNEIWVFTLILILYYKKKVYQHVKHAYSNEVPTALFVSGGATRFPYGGAK